MKTAARLFFGPCHHVMACDLGWPLYEAVLQQEARRTGRRVTAASVRDGVSRRGWSEDDAIAALREWYAKGGCDGLFLCAVSNLGVRLPVAKIVQSLEASAPVRFVVVDGAQELNHLPADLSREYCDLYIAGAHKWLGGFHPMGIGFYGRRRSRGMVETRLARWIRSGDIDDPLLRFSAQCESGQTDALIETVSLMPLFSAHGAMSDALRPSPDNRVATRGELTALAVQAGWKPLLPDPSMQSAILLFQSAQETVCRRLPAEIREHFGRQGVALTAYPEGTIRLSLPRHGLAASERDLLRASLETAC